MAERNLNNSWNPLNYSQNLCVNTIVSNNPSLTSVATNENTDIFTDSRRDDNLVDPFSALDLQQKADHGINQLVNDLITNNNIKDNNDLRFDCFQSYTKSNSIRNPFSEDITANSSNNVFDCGDFGIESFNKPNVATLSANGLNGGNGFNTLIDSQTSYNRNSFQHLIAAQDVMSAQSYAEIKSFPQQIRPSNQFTKQINSRVSDLQTNPLANPMTNPLTNSLTNSMTNQMVNPLMGTMGEPMRKILPNTSSNSGPNPMTNQLSTSLSSGFSQLNSNQSVVQSLMAQKSHPLSYDQKQTLQKLAPIEVSANEMSQMGSRQLRSIRARSVSQSSAEPINKVNYYLEKSYEQFKHLEKERKKIECELIQAFVGHKISSANNIPIQRLPQNASKVDRIITDMSREHAKVITIVAKMEQLKGRELSELIHNSIHKWYEIIRELQMKRKIENQRNATNIGSIASSEELFIGQFCEIMKQLLSGIRAVRTCLWCALVITLYEQNMA